jgi:short subunit fatty acids transporter
LASIKKEMKEKKKQKDIQKLLEASKVLIIIVVTSFKVWLRIYRSYGDSLKNQK